jgi:hypothetical protein
VASLTAASRAHLDDVLVRRGAGARRGVRLDSWQPSFTEVPMRLIGLAVILTHIR